MENSGKNLFATFPLFLLLFSLKFKEINDNCDCKQDGNLETKIINF